MRPVVVVVILPLFQLRIEEVNVVGDAVLVEELVELLIVDTMGPLDLAVQVWRSRPSAEEVNTVVSCYLSVVTC